MIRFVAVLAVVPIAAACGGDNGGDVALCTEVYAAGASLPEGAEDEPCIDATGDAVLLGAALYSCDSGAEVAVNQYGAWNSADRVMLDIDLSDPTVADIDAACG